ncbi:hypothetical protein B0H14DRAFT_2641341 [Mycena olivaceomarginata]|nr:hypothetical protein B0H14DRAFT_2641341 [Mycena olivaceomarginata]
MRPSQAKHSTCVRLCCARDSACESVDVTSVGIVVGYEAGMRRAKGGVRMRDQSPEHPPDSRAKAGQRAEGLMAEWRTGGIRSTLARLVRARMRGRGTRELDGGARRREKHLGRSSAGSDFHHALNWLLAELFKHVGGLDDTALREAGYSSVREIILLYYRDFMLRELCYDQDLFVLQTALIVLPPDTVFVSILDRFGHTGYFAGATLHAHYEGAQLSPMVEELLYVLIVIMGERAAAARVGVRGAVRPTSSTRSRSALALSCVTEHLVDDRDGVLPRTGKHRRRRCVGATRRGRADSARASAAGIAEPVLIPKPLEIGMARSQRCRNVVVLTEEAGVALPSAEAILDQALHLVMLALVERPAEFSLAVRESTMRCTGRIGRARRGYWEMENHVPEQPAHGARHHTREGKQFEGGEKRAVAKARQKAGEYNFTKIRTCSDRDAMHTHSKSVLVWDQIGVNDRRLLSQTSALEQKEVEELSLRAQVDELIQSCNQHLRALEQARTALQVSSSRAEEVHVQYDRRASRSARSRWMLENNTRTEPLEVRKYNTYESREGADAFRGLTTGNLGTLLDSHRDLKTDERAARGHAEKTQAIEAEASSLRRMLKGRSLCPSLASAYLSQPSTLPSGPGPQQRWQMMGYLRDPVGRPHTHTERQQQTDLVADPQIAPTNTLDLRELGQLQKVSLSDTSCSCISLLRQMKAQQASFADTFDDAVYALWARNAAGRSQLEGGTNSWRK